MKLQFIEAGEIVTTHGIHGEVKVLPWEDGPEVLPGAEDLQSGEADGYRNHGRCPGYAR